MLITENGGGDIERCVGIDSFFRRQPGFERDRQRRRRETARFRELPIRWCFWSEGNSAFSIDTKAKKSLGRVYRKERLHSTAVLLFAIKYDRSRVHQL
jgi:hypothetical protein